MKCRNICIAKSKRKLLSQNVHMLFGWAREKMSGNFDKLKTF